MMSADDLSMSRRGAMVAIASWVGAVGLGGLVVGAGCKDDPAGAPGDLVGALACQGRGAAELGEIYLKGHPEERDADRLVSLLLPDAPAKLKRSEAMRRLKEASAREYAADEIVTLDGWMLSRTEARVLALAAVAPCAA